MRHIGKLVLVAALFAGACGGGSNTNDAPPRVIPGGGVGDGAIKGKLNVYVIESNDKANTPIAGATVRIGLASDAMAKTGTTDSTGLFTLADGALDGPQTITVTAAGHSAATMIGVNGANVTLGLDKIPAAAPTMATVDGGITGWDALPAPATGHYLLGIVGYSSTDNFDDPANKLTPPNQTLFGQAVPGNLCARISIAGMNINQCAWKLNVRTGKQAHFAVIFDATIAGMLPNPANDKLTPIGFALKGGLDLASGSNTTGEMLDAVPMQDATVAFPAMAPTGLGSIQGIAIVKLAGDDGRVLLTIPFSPTVTMSKLPMLTGALAGASYEFLAQAQASATVAEPKAFNLLHGVDLGATITVPAFLAPPAAPTASGGNFSFGAVAGATIQQAEFHDSMDRKVWQVTLFDSSTSFSLPTLTPDPMPTGMVRMRASALVVPGLDLTSFQVEGLFDKIAQESEAEVTFTH